MRTFFDVAIVGGGPAGTATAIALAREGARVVLLERTDYNVPRFGETLPPRTRVPLVRLGVWERFLAQGHIPSPAMASAWGDESLYEAHAIFNPYGHGWHIDRRRFDEGLADAAVEAGACIVRDVRAVSCHAGTPAWRLEYTSAARQQILHASVFVDASGRTSSLARTQGARRIAYDRLVGVVGFIADPPPAAADNRTLVEAVETGWWYSARLPDGSLVVAYMTDADLMPRGKAPLLADYLSLLDKAPHTRGRVHGGRHHLQLHIRSANSSRLDPVAGPNWLAVGDAAMAYDPLSSQGICRALESGLAAARVIACADAERAYAIEEYERQSRQAFEAYLRKRTEYYERETRWRRSAFWNRRRPATPGASAGSAGRSLPFIADVGSMPAAR